MSDREILIERHTEPFNPGLVKVAASDTKLEDKIDALTEMANDYEVSVDRLQSLRYQFEENGPKLSPEEFGRLKNLIDQFEMQVARQKRELESKQIEVESIRKIEQIRIDVMTTKNEYFAIKKELDQVHALIKADEDQCAALYDSIRKRGIRHSELQRSLYEKKQRLHELGVLHELGAQI